MKVTPVLKAINRHAAIHVFMAVFFASCWFAHFAATKRMESGSEQFAVMNDQTLRAMALIEWVANHAWAAVAYVLLAVASVAFLQVRGRPSWTYWLTAALLCVPCTLYWVPCAYLVLKLVAPVTFK